jgi:hypothetical protein
LSIGDLAQALYWVAILLTSISFVLFCFVLLRPAAAHEKAVTPAPAPTIALDAADEPLAVVVDFDQRSMAVKATLYAATVSHGAADIR